MPRWDGGVHQRVDRLHVDIHASFSTARIRAVHASAEAIALDSSNEESIVILGEVAKHTTQHRPRLNCGSSSTMVTGSVGSSGRDDSTRPLPPLGSRIEVSTAHSSTSTVLTMSDAMPAATTAQTQIPPNAKIKLTSDCDSWPSRNAAHTTNTTSGMGPTASPILEARGQ